MTRVEPADSARCYTNLAPPMKVVAFSDTCLLRCGELRRNFDHVSEIHVPVPTYDALMLPVLKRSADRTWSMQELIAQVADDQNLSQEERDELIPSGATTL